MSDVLINNFTSGEVTPKLGGRPDLGIYHTGAAWIENFLLMIQGGLTRRPGTKLIRPLNGPCRLIPFTLSVDLAFIIEIRAGLLVIKSSDGSDYPLLIGGFPAEGIPVGYTTGELEQIQFTQTYNTLYLAHRNHAPFTLQYYGGSFVWENLIPDTDRITLGAFQSVNNYPGCVAYCSNRLWFGSSYNQPYRLWASRPFYPTNFKTFDIVTTVDKVIMDAPWPVGWEDNQNLIYEDITTTREITSADNAMVLEVGSNRNDRIEWLTVGQNLIVGTASGEWLMPGNIDALNQNIIQASAYGSASLQALNVNEDILFIQSGKKRCRGYVMSANGYESPDITYIADHILIPGVKEWAFQRVPEPRCYIVLENGDMAVLIYNKMYGMQGWGRWTFTGEVKSVVVMDVPTGQEVFISIKRGDVYYLEKFDEGSGVFKDQHNTAAPIDYLSRVVSNRFETQLDSGTTIGKQKRMASIVLRLLDSGPFQAGYNGLETYSESISAGDVLILLGGGYEKELQMEIRSIEGNPLTILAMVYGMEVG